MTEFTKEWIRSVRMCSYLIEPPASEVIEHLCDEIERQAQRIAELEQERRWIPVSDKENLPEVGVEILGWEVRRNRYVLDWLKYRDMLSKDEPTFLFSFDYWQPLPQPPQEGE